MKSKLIFSFILILFLVSFVSSSDFIFKQNSQVNLTIPCIIDDKYCSLSSSCNLTITNPLGNVIVDNVVMTVNINFHNYTLTEFDTAKVGIYKRDVQCCDGALCGFGSDTFTINPTGSELTTGTSIIYVVTSFVFFLFFLLSFYFTLATPYGNEVSENGMVFKVTKLKYVKLFFIMLSYILFILFLNALIGISENFLTITLFSGILGFLFQTLNYLAWPFGIFIIILSFFEIIRDANFTKNTKDLMGASTRT